MSAAPTRCGVGCGPAEETTRWVGSGSEARAGVGAPAGSFTTVPIRSGAAGSRPFAAAIESSDTPALRGEAAERVAGAHDVGAEHGGRARVGAAARGGRGGLRRAAVRRERRGALGRRSAR